MSWNNAMNITETLNCSVRFPNWSSKTRPLVALVSFPGSGNTWTRHLLEIASGIYTGSIGNDRGLFRGGFRGQLEDYRKGNTLIVKTHYCDRKHEFSSAILLIRNPYNAIIAEYRRRHGDHVSRFPLQNITGKYWEEFVAEHSSYWQRLHKCWLTEKRRILVVYYEDLKKDTISNIDRMMSFLNLTFTAERRRCVEENKEGNFYRKPTKNRKGSKFDPYTNSLHKLINGYITYIDRILKEDGHSPIHPASKLL
ncbi:sialate:O-sulfotransferase 2-like [Glandiceps talaboti]